MELEQQNLTAMQMYGISFMEKMQAKTSSLSDA